MGTINIEGLGIVEIEGDEPNEIEQNAILEAIQGEGDPDITFGEETVIPEEQEDRSELEAFLGEPEIGSKIPEAEPPTARQFVRKKIEELPGLVQLIAEAGPSIGGALGGAALGAPLGPPGVIGGAIIGGLGGEVIAQETGLAPKSDLNLILSAAGPLGGPAVGGVLKGGRRLIGGAVTKFPFARTARARTQLSAAVEEFESLGTRIIEKQKGLKARPAGELYEAVRRAGVIVPSKSLKNTRDALRSLSDEMDEIRAFPEVRQAGRLLKQIEASIDKADDISLDTIVRIRQLVGIAVKRAQTQGGIKLGNAKKVYATISDDLDKIATDPSLTGRAARLAKAATQRAKLEFAVKDMEAGVARFVTDTGGKEGITINIAGLQKWLRTITNPKSKKFNKNFTDALKDELPAINERLTALAKIASVGGPAGPGSIVVRGQTARIGRSVIGGLIGFGAAGPIGAGAGGLIGAQGPEMLTSLLMTKTGSAFLERAARLGKGQISMRVWIIAGQLAAQAAGESDAPKISEAALSAL